MSLKPLRIPAEFWLRNATREALRSRDVGAVFRLLRRYLGVSQTKIGMAAGLEQGYVSKVMSGRRAITAIDVLERIADGCGMPDECRVLLGLAPASNEPQPEADDAMLRRDILRLPLVGLAVDPTRPSGTLVGTEVPAQLRLRAARLRRLDDVLGGADTFRAYLAEYRATAELLRSGIYSDHTGRELLSVLAEQAQQAGWAAFDAGRHVEAAHLYKASFQTADRAEDRPLAANALALRAYQLIETHPNRAARLAQRSCHLAGTGAPGQVRALLYERHALVRAVTGDARGAEDALREASDALDRVRTSGPDWAQWVDHDELSIMAGRCWAVLRRPRRAVDALEHVLTRFSDANSRDKALYLSYLAEAYLHSRDIEQAALVAERAVVLSEGVASPRPRRRIKDVLDRLVDHRRRSKNVDGVLRRAVERSRARGLGRSTSDPREVGI